MIRNVGEAERYTSMLGGLGLILAGLERRGLGGIILGALGAAFIQRGVTGHCALYQQLGMSSAGSDRPGVPDNVGITFEQSVVIHRPLEEVYAFWRHLPNLAGAMPHVERVDVLDNRFSHWVVHTSQGHRLEWDSVIINERFNEMIAWESLPGADLENAGSVRFEPEPHGNGTVVILKMEYNPPGGLLKRLGAALLGERAEKEIGEELLQLKKKLES